MNNITKINNYLSNIQREHGKPKKILLFRIPTINYNSFDIKAQKKSGYGTHQAISITTLAANLIKRTNINVKCVDLEYESLLYIFENNSIDNILEELTIKHIKKFKPDIIGLSVIFSPGIQNGFKVSKIAHNLMPKSLIVFGGVHCTFDYKNILDNTPSKIVFLNESDDSLPEFIGFLNKTLKHEDVHGVAFKYSKKNYINLPLKKYPDFQNLPTPAWNLIDTKNYYKVTHVCGLKNVIEEEKPTAIIQTLRGCIARCTFCSVRNFNGSGVRFKSAETVLDEMEMLVKDYGIKYFEIVDDDFSANVKRSIEICKGIVKRDLNIIWSLDNGIRLLTITEELAENLVASGCRLISVGVESGNKEIMHRIKKPLTIPGLYKKMEMMQKYPEIYVKGNFIVGFPFETYEQLQETFKVANEINFDWRIFSIYSPLVGTEALNSFDEETRNEIVFSENNYGSAEILPDGYENIKDFQNDVYLNNLKCNFLNNPNANGEKLGYKRAQKDFERILNEIDEDHPLCHLMLHKIHKKNNPILSKEHKDKYIKIINKSEKWKFFCSKLGLPNTDYQFNEKFYLKDFRSGREMDGQLFV